MYRLQVQLNPSTEIVLLINDRADMIDGAHRLKSAFGDREVHNCHLYKGNDHLVSAMRGTSLHHGITNFVLPYLELYAEGD